MKVPDILREQDFYAIQHLVTAVSSFRCTRILGISLMPDINAPATTDFQLSPGMSIKALRHSPH